MHERQTQPQPRTGEDGFPTWLTGPNGERQVFYSLEEVPAGWTRKDGTPVGPPLEPEDAPKRRGRPPAQPVIDESDF